MCSVLLSVWYWANWDPCQQGILEKTHTLPLSSLNPVQILVSGVCVREREYVNEDWIGGMQCLCWRAGSGPVWPWWLNRISMQPFITACTLRNMALRSEHTLCCHSQDSPNWDKMKSVRTYKISNRDRDLLFPLVFRENNSTFSLEKCWIYFQFFQLSVLISVCHYNSVTCDSEDQNQFVFLFFFPLQQVFGQGSLRSCALRKWVVFHIKVQQKQMSRRKGEEGAGGDCVCPFHMVSLPHVTLCHTLCAAFINMDHSWCVMTSIQTTPPRPTHIFFSRSSFCLTGNGTGCQYIYDLLSGAF